MRIPAVAALALASALAGGVSCAPAPEAKTAPAAAAIATETLWTVDYARSKLGFSASQTGATFTGRFEKYQALISFDPDDLSKTSIEVTIDMTSARTGDRQRDLALPGSDWFKTKEFPTARFVATEVQKLDDGTYVAQGALEMRGVRRSLGLPFTLEISGDTAAAKGETSILRTDWGVGEGEFADATWVDLDVKATFEIAATR